jgi:hypothetical protein
MYRDFEKQRRVYFDKQTGDYLKDEAFHPSDFQKKLDFDAEEERLRLEDIARQQQIETNNAVGNYADRQPDENGFYRDADGNLTDIKPTGDIFDPVDSIIVDKKIGKVKERPTPKDNLHPMHGRDLEPADEPVFPDEDDLLAPTE